MPSCCVISSFVSLRPHAECGRSGIERPSYVDDSTLTIGRQHQEDVLQCDGIAYTLSVTLKHTIPHDKCTQTRTRCCKEPFAYAHVAGPHSHNARCQECYSLQAIGLQQFAPCRSTLISHATKCTQNWNHAMHSNAIAHTVHEDSGRDRSGSRGISAVSTAAREAEAPPCWIGVAGASHCMCTTLCIETRTEILTGCISNNPASRQRY